MENIQKMLSIIILMFNIIFLTNGSNGWENERIAGFQVRIETIICLTIIFV